MRFSPLLSAVIVTLAAPAAAQSVDDQSKGQQVEAVRLANDKARLSLVDPLRSISPPDAKVATLEKAAEVQLLKVKLYQGLASPLVDQLRPPDRLAASAFSPVVVIGSAPPTTAHWAALSAQCDKLDQDITDGLDRKRVARL